MLNLTKDYVVNYVNGIYLESNLDHLDPLEYQIICKVDKEWIAEEIYKIYEITRIANGYVVLLDNKLYYNNSNQVYLIELRESL